MSPQSKGRIPDRRFRFRRFAVTCAALALATSAAVPASSEPVKTATASKATAPAAPEAQIADPAPEGVRIDEAGVFGNYFRASGRGKHPAILVLGGSEGGLSESTMRAAKALQGHGFNALQLGYFAVPGGPDALADVPLETFERALAWLRARPEVEPNRIGLAGVSKGAEAALVFASRERAIRGVVAAHPSGVVFQGLSAKPQPQSSWTAGGRELPYLRYISGPGGGLIRTGFENGLKTLGDHPDAAIHVENINGPILLTCGRDDRIWPSCAMSEQIIARLKARHYRFNAELLAYENAGHVFGPPNPDELFLFGGGTAEGNEHELDDSWPRVLAFFDRILKHGRKP